MYVEENRISHRGAVGVSNSSSSEETTMAASSLSADTSGLLQIQAISTTVRWNATKITYFPISDCSSSAGASNISSLAGDEVTLVLDFLAVSNVGVGDNKTSTSPVAMYTALEVGFLLHDFQKIIA